MEVNDNHFFQTFCFANSGKIIIFAELLEIYT